MRRLPTAQRTGLELAPDRATTTSGLDNVIDLFPEDADRQPHPDHPGDPDRPGDRDCPAGRPRMALTLVQRIRTGPAEAGMATAEYAIATLAAVGFAGLLVAILRSDEVRGFLLAIIRSALSIP